MQHYLNPSQSEWDSLTERPTASYDSLEPLVATVFDVVKADGDQALIKYTAEFDGIQLADFRVSEEELRLAVLAVPLALKKAIQNAKENIERFHEAQKTETVKVSTQAGVDCWQEKKANRKGRLVYTRRISTFIFYGVDVSHSRSNRRM